MHLGKPTKVKDLINALMIVGALVFLTLTASGNLEDISIMVKR